MDLLEPLYTAAEMRTIDGVAIEKEGIAGLDLMENAGAAVAAAVNAVDSYGPVRIVCGKGNNGGDGLVCARILSDGRRDLKVLLLAPERDFKGDAKVNLDRFKDVGGDLVEIQDGDQLQAALSGAAVLVDAILGTGVAGAPRGLAGAAIPLLNAHSAPVLSVDIPSGIDASSGELLGQDAVKAKLTVTLQAAKVGLLIRPGRDFVGELEIVDIGIPKSALETVAASACLIGPGLLSLYPRRGLGDSKFSSGTLLVVGGSTGLTGAACLTAEAAMRSGAGYVKAAVPSSLNSVFEEKLLEVMTVPAPDSDGVLGLEAIDVVLAAANRADAVVVGPGLGRSPYTQELVRELVRSITLPLLVDADGLNALGTDLGLLAARTSETVLTPHSGELARLLDLTSEQVERSRLDSAQTAAQRSGSTVVLKGSDTIVVAGDTIAVNPPTTPALATAGTGDVLAGIAGALLAKKLTAFEAASLAVYFHSEAAVSAVSAVGQDGLIASDVIEALPSVLDEQ